MSRLWCTHVGVGAPNGRLPALTPEAQRRITSPERRRLKDVREGRVPADSYEQLDLGDRCIWYRGVPSLPTAYNNNWFLSRMYARKVSPLRV